MFEKIKIIHNNSFYTIEEIKPLILQKISFLNSQKYTKFIICEEDNFEFILKFIAGILSKKEIFLIPDKIKAKNIQGDYIKEIPQEAGANNTNINIKDIEPEKQYINFYTSGSTGTPKIIKKSLQNLINEANDIGKTFPQENNIEIITTTRMTHMFGMTFALMFPLINNYIINADIIKFPEQIKSKNFTFISTPSFLDKMVKYDNNLGKPKYIFTAGDKLKTPTFEYFEKNSNVVEIYGSTEAGIIAHKTASKSDFKPFKNVKISTTPDNEIKVSSDYFMENEIVMNDIIEKTPEGFKITGRTDRIIKIQEKRISAEELENYLRLSEYTEDAYCFKYGEKIAAAVSLNKKGLEYASNNPVLSITKLLKSHIKTSCEIIPQKWRYINEIPKTISGKINKKQILKYFDTNLTIPVSTYKKCSENSAEIGLIFKKESNFFNGHFENYPILPGVVQVFFAHFFAEEVFNTEIPQNEIKRLKFIKVIKPETEVILTLTNNSSSIDYKYSERNGKIFSSGTLNKQ